MTGISNLDIKLVVVLQRRDYINTKNAALIITIKMRKRID